MLSTVIEPARATTILKMSDDDMVRHAALIIEGKVKKIASKWNADNTQIHSFIDIDVTNEIKGALAQDPKRIQIRVLGGTVGNVTMVIVDAPVFEVDEEVLLILRPNFDKWLFPIVGFNQGKFRIDTDPNTGKKTVRERRVSRDSFIAELKQKVARQTPKSGAANGGN